MSGGSGLDRLIALEREGVERLRSSEDSLVAGLERLNADVDAGALPRFGDGAAAAGGAGGTKLALVALLVGGGLTAAWFIRGEGPPEKIHVALESSPAETSAGDPAMSPEGDEAAPATSSPEAPNLEAAAEATPTDSVARPAGDPVAGDETMPSPTAHSAARVQQTQTRASADARADASKSKHGALASAPAPKPDAPGDELAEQLTMLRAAEAASRAGHDAAVLRHAREYAERFATPLFNEDMSALATISQCRRDPQRAAEYLRGFEAAHARSIHRTRVADACTDEAP